MCTFAHFVCLKWLYKFVTPFVLLKIQLSVTVASISSIVHNMDRAPTDPNNNAKVAKDGNGSWFCEKNNITYSHYLPRYALCCCIQGSDGQMWITAYNDHAQAILGGIEAKVVESYQQEANVSAYEKAFCHTSSKKFGFRLRAKCDTYEDEHNAFVVMLLT